MHTNRLASEQSPYLRQHAHNPVDWYPWGEEAFAKARAQDKPIFLSIGYSTCHWCHVMERESFENQDIASILNRAFVPIKVDREERPDVDRIYMTFVQATSGGGGWPMSVFLTPRLEPFFGGTYFPPDNRYGRPGFKSLLEHLEQAWLKDRTRIDESGSRVIGQLRRYLETSSSQANELDEKALEAGFNALRSSFDSKYGGFGGAPKFPRPVALNFLLRYYKRTGNREALEMTLLTLRAMAAGGIDDHLGGGFHRYSVDERWFVPHFEKMLYDQAQLAVSYLEAFQITRDEFFATQARAIFEYVLRDMAHPDGGFFSAEDADSEGSEGAFYIWTRDEIERVLGASMAAVFSRRYGVEPEGNVREDPHHEFTGRNILFAAHDGPEDLSGARSKLLEVRSRRVRPHLDDKILTAWNGLMISAFAKAAQILDDARYGSAAVRAAQFVLDGRYDSKTGMLARGVRAGFLDDYAFFAQALLDLYETGFDPARIELAAALMEKAIDLFEDREHGAFFSTVADDPNLLLRIKDDYDGAEPSGNSIAILVLLRLAQFTGRSTFREAAERALQALSHKIAQQPSAVPQLLVAADFALGSPRQIVLAGESLDAMLRVVRSHFLPVSVTMVNPRIDGMKPVNNRPTAYVCRDFVCQLPVTGLDDLNSLLQ